MCNYAVNVQLKLYSVGRGRQLRHWLPLLLQSKFKWLQHFVYIFYLLTFIVAVVVVVIMLVVIIVCFRLDYRSSLITICTITVYQSSLNGEEAECITDIIFVPWEVWSTMCCRIVAKLSSLYSESTKNTNTEGHPACKKWGMVEVGTG